MHQLFTTGTPVIATLAWREDEMPDDSNFVVGKVDKVIKTDISTYYVINGTRYPADRVSRGHNKFCFCESCLGVE